MFADGFRKNYSRNISQSTFITPQISVHFTYTWSAVVHVSTFVLLHSANNYTTYHQASALLILSHRADARLRFFTD